MHIYRIAYISISLFQSNVGIKFLLFHFGVNTSPINTHSAFTTSAIHRQLHIIISTFRSDNPGSKGETKIFHAIQRFKKSVS